MEHALVGIDDFTLTFPRFCPIITRFQGANGEEERGFFRRCPGKLYPIGRLALPSLEESLIERPFQRQVTVRPESRGNARRESSHALSQDFKVTGMS